MADNGPPGEDAIIEWLVEHVAREVKIAPDGISVDEAFFDIGLNSLSTLIVSGELGEFLGYEDFNPTLFWDYPTIRKLAGYLASQPLAAAEAGAGRN